ncbi:hypothetical protein CAI21_02275 [Alkalilimnicola ehrlichii]|uniref:Uncharacterized protein n=1 Tax=Alkalilimnicola ehrlichii TaxID=351052 RepID=A0A3E0X0U5_9GAMM|nr:hypothetical protein [Alkalilimnicola ehrlichii]RFA31456.1 hypothetical protein CAI21_02275 [Alkalilimnicola ehrlichii]RFA39273.1 hypothetical protein CAL65_00115 [Alkalilimnicola ehrlichii]
MKAKDMFKHQLKWALLAYAVGVLVLALAVALRSLSVGMAAALFILSISLGARATMRCPFCQRSVASDIIRWPLVWESRVPERCPHCNTELDKNIY